MLLKYSIVMTSSIALLTKVKNGSGGIIFKWLINLYTSIRSPLCLLIDSLVLIAISKCKTMHVLAGLPLTVILTS